eukprot:scaffold7938_cov286-Pinguiococcus_pyrenoidosus.AAC.4
MFNLKFVGLPNHGAEERDGVGNVSKRLASASQISGQGSPATQRANLAGARFAVYRRGKGPQSCGSASRKAEPQHCPARHRTSGAAVRIAASALRPGETMRAIVVKRCLSESAERRWETGLAPKTEHKSVLRR